MKKYYPRKIEKELQKQVNSEEIVVLTGMRRTGKSMIMRHIFDSIDSSNKIYLDLENILNRKIFEEENYDNIWSNLLPLGISKDQKCYIFLDEIQFMRNIPSVIKYLFDNFEVKFFLTGSSSYYLKNLFSESLSGRKFIFELFPLDFEEYLWFREKKKIFGKTFIDKEKSRNKIQSVLYEKDYAEYLEFGGFPPVVLEKDFDRKLKKINDIFTSYFELDVKTLADFRNISKFRDLIILLSARCGSKVEITKLASELQVSRETVYNYLAFLEQTYFITLLRPYTKNSDREVSGAKKVYFCDNGMLKLLGGVSAGAIFENAVFNNLKNYKQINYYQRRAGAEIDFVIDKKIGLEVKSRGSKAYLDKAKKIAEKIGLVETYVVSKDYVSEEGMISAVDL
ncbi:MAG: ATP-binding protein [Candidatus Moranbacteria bacterium]|nr:ATP-binding protein [Candidatus Moranbacteria bacterium]